MERRSVIKNIGGLFLTPSLLASSKGKKPVLRVAHLTDVHMKNELEAPTKFAKCLHHVQQQNPKVDFILNGGDIVFDMNKANLSAINDQWNLLNGILKSECSLPIHYCLGNHDVWWSEDSKGQTDYGKKYSLEKLNLTKSYYSFTQKGWKFIILDSIQLDVDNTWFIGKLGDEQFAWLANELKNTDPSMPVLVLSHVPILTATLMIKDNIVNKWQMSRGDMHTDTAKIIDLFYQYPNVKICLSGHVHLRDKVQYNNVTYICNGAVSGAWWNGNNRQTAPGYGVLDLYADGSFEEKYVNY
ncbi:metallophosphoesterase family protein [Arcicella rigui]|uniref:Metallophosphoesterase n=1 Tax=Arcicella rigui TaxID=797020 RepID=A0ABU5QBA2_9BACT|nr:metallophosphoesterase [Arcicella rigui]MEA5140114.1 metallophosphoesterase [Arcicella rigui]